MRSKTATIQYKPLTSFAGNNNALAQYKQSRGVNQISHALSNIHGLYRCSCNLFDVISIYSLNPCKLPGRFSYERPGYEATFYHALPSATQSSIDNFTVNKRMLMRCNCYVTSHPEYTPCLTCSTFQLKSVLNIGEFKICALASCTAFSNKTIANQLSAHD